ncbi:unnamed protein product [Rhizopus stolonifer]
MVKDIELVLSEAVSSSVYIEKFRYYVKTRASVISILKEYYSNETLKTSQTYFPGSITEFSIRARGNLYYGQILHLYASYLEIMLKQKHILQRLNATTKDSLNELIAKMFKSNESNDLKQNASTQLEQLQILPFRKRKFSKVWTRPYVNNR